MLIKDDLNFDEGINLEIRYRLIDSENLIRFRHSDLLFENLKSFSAKEGV